MALSASGGDDVFLDQQLQGVGDGLQQAVRPHAHGSQADLEIGQHLPLDQRRGSRPPAGTAAMSTSVSTTGMNKGLEMIACIASYRLPQQRSLRQPQERLGIDADRRA